MMFKEAKSTEGKKYAGPARVVAEEEEIRFARKARLRKLALDDGKGNSCIVRDAKLAETAKDVSAFKLTLRYQGREVDTDFQQGSAHLDPPEFWSVLHCLLLDVSGIEDETFESWCSNFGYDTDSRKAEQTFNACRDTLPRVRRLLGKDFDEVRALDEDDLRTRFENVPTVRGKVFS